MNSQTSDSSQPILNTLSALQVANPRAIHAAFADLCGGLLGLGAILPEGQLLIDVNESRLELALAEFEKLKRFEIFADTDVSIRHKLPELASLYLENLGLKFVQRNPQRPDGVMVLKQENNQAAREALQNLKADLDRVIVVGSLTNARFSGYGSDTIGGSPARYFGVAGG